MIVMNEIIGLLTETKRQGIDNVIRQLVRGGFFTAPASVSYHNNSEGGLAKHSLDVYKHAIDEAEYQIQMDQMPCNRLQTDSLTLCALLHDVCKMDEYCMRGGRPHHTPEYSRSKFHRHGTKSVALLESWGLELTEDEKMAIKCHMGIHTHDMGTSFNYSVEAAKTPLVAVIHTADSKSAKITNTITNMPNKIDDYQKRVNATIFEHTMAIAAMGSYQSPSGQTICLDQSEMHQGSRMYDTELSAVAIPVRPEPTTYRVDQADCLDVAEDLVCRGYKPAMLNMASGGHPGGGVVNGARAQEETICRRSNLACSIFRFHSRTAYKYQLPHISGVNYPMNAHFGGVYSPAVTIFRRDSRHGYELMEQPYRVDVISVAAINGNRFHEHFDAQGNFTASGVTMTVDKIRTIYRIALLNGNDSLVLGALGCGAFKNPPHQVASLMRQVLEEPEFKNKFRLVTVAIIEDHNSHGRNYNAFAQNFITA